MLTIACTIAISHGLKQTEKFIPTILNGKQLKIFGIKHMVVLTEETDMLLNIKIIVIENHKK